MSTYTRTAYWWDVDWLGSGGKDVIVESSHPEHREIARWPDSMEARERAESLICDLNEGRTTLKKVLARYGHG